MTTSTASTATRRTAPGASDRLLAALDTAAVALVAAAEQGVDRRALDRAAASLAGARAEVEGVRVRR